MQHHRRTLIQLIALKHLTPKPAMLLSHADLLVICTDVANEFDWVGKFHGPVLGTGGRTLLAVEMWFGYVNWRKLMSVRSTLNELSYRMKDFFQYSPLVARTAGMVAAAAGVLTPFGVARLRQLTKAYSKIESGFLQRALAHRIHGLCSDPTAGDVSGHTRYSDVAANSFLNRGIVLKAPGPNGERGVIHLTPEYNWLRLMATDRAIEELADKFTFWLTISWSPADYHLLGLIARDYLVHFLSHRATVGKCLN